MKIGGGDRTSDERFPSGEGDGVERARPTTSRCVMKIVGIKPFLAASGLEERVMVRAVSTVPVDLSMARGC